MDTFSVQKKISHTFPLAFRVSAAMEHDCSSATFDYNFRPMREIDGRNKREDAPPKKKSRFVPDPESVAAERKYDPESVAAERKYDPGSIAMEQYMIMKTLPKNDIPAYVPNVPPKKFHEMTDEELWLSCSASMGGMVSIETVKDEIPKLRNYYRQLHESEGFDLDENPKICLTPAGLLKAECCRERCPKSYEKFMALAQFAIDETFNKENNTEFKVSEVVSVNQIYCLAMVCFITFTAGNVVEAGGSDPASAAADSASCKKTFQARVRTWTTLGTNVDLFRSVEICRLKG